MLIEVFRRLLPTNHPTHRSNQSIRKRAVANIIASACVGCRYARVSNFEDQALYGFIQPNLENLELELNADLDGDGNITNDAGMSGDFEIYQKVVKRQQDGVKETNHSFFDY